MKMYKKSELKLVDGLLLAPDGTVVSPVGNVVAQANSLDTALQKATYLQAQPKATPMPSLDGFERKSCFSTKHKFHVETPLIDGKSEEAIALMDEIDDLDRANQVNKFLDKFEELIRFADSDSVVCTDSDAMEVFDTPMIGDPLMLSGHDIACIAGMIHGIFEVGDDAPEENDGQSE